jgi:hypothetical protein
MRFFSAAVTRRPGQILFPALLVLPSLLIFVYLLFETTKISREKIRQQFAVDSAAFIQMGDYTNLLNRTAYVNGPFPYRIFREAWSCPFPPEDYVGFDDDSGEACPYELLYDSGAFPRNIKDQGYTGEPAKMDKEPIWEIQFNQGDNNDNNKTKAWGDTAVRSKFKTVPNDEDPTDILNFTTQLQGSFVKIPWPKVSNWYTFYAQVYSLLGSVEESQLTVFERLTENFNFFRKSYYLNASTEECSNNPAGCGEQGVNSNNGFRQNVLVRGLKGVRMHYLLSIAFHGKVHTGGFPSPYFLGKTNPPMSMINAQNPKGLFQLATVHPDILVSLGNGLDVYQVYKAPGNYFGVDFNDIAACRETNRPCVHARIATQCPQVGGGNNCVWPNPTPKYQTRLYP